MALLVVFFGVVAIILEQKIFEPIIDLVLGLDTETQPGVLFMANGVLSMFSDNVFVATIFIEGVASAYHDDGPNSMNMTTEHFGKLGVAISMVTAFNAFWFLRASRLPDEADSHLFFAVSHVCM